MSSDVLLDGTIASTDLYIDFESSLSELDSDELWAIRLRLSGYTYDEMAERMGFDSKASPYNIIDEVRECLDWLIE